MRCGTLRAGATRRVHVRCRRRPTYTRVQCGPRAKRGAVDSSRDAANPVEVALSDETEFKHRGTMDFVDNAMNPQTGTIRGRAVLANPDGAFTPGLFARVRLLGAAPRDALLIHDQAVLTVTMTFRACPVTWIESTPAHRSQGV